MLNLQNPIRTEKRRGFQPPWYTVYIYRCKGCGKETTVRANSFRGPNPEPGVGAIRCPHCEKGIPGVMGTATGRVTAADCARAVDNHKEYGGNYVCGDCGSVLTEDAQCPTCKH